MVTICSTDFNKNRLNKKRDKLSPIVKHKSSTHVALSVSIKTNKEKIRLLHVKWVKNIYIYIT